jgi:hypothetical protein
MTVRVLAGVMEIKTMNIPGLQDKACVQAMVLVIKITFTRAHQAKANKNKSARVYVSGTSKPYGS